MQRGAAEVVEGLDARGRRRYNLAGRTMGGALGQQVAVAVVDGGVDVLLLETCNDTRSVKAGLLGIERLRQQLGVRIPIMLSATIEPMGSMLAGQGADAFWTSVSHADLTSVGAIAAEVVARAVNHAVITAIGIPGYPASRDLSPHTDSTE